MIGLRTHKQASCRLGIPDLPDHLKDGIRELSSVQSGNQRKGHGTNLLYQVCAEADREGKVLLLKVEDNENKERLQKWYERFGFTEIQPEPLLMGRQVQKTRIQHG